MDEGKVERDSFHTRWPAKSDQDRHTYMWKQTGEGSPITEKSLPTPGENQPITETPKKRRLPRSFVISMVALASCFVAFYCLGIYIGRSTFEPAVITQTETVIDYQTVEKIVYVDKPVVEYVEKIVERGKDSRSFSSLQELEQWLNEGELTISIRFKQPDFDCDDFALQLQDRALKDGYKLDLELIRPREYNRLFEKAELGPNEIHAINLALIGNEAYYIEPQNYEVVFVANID